MAAKRKINDNDRAQWIDNDEGLWREWGRSGKAKRLFIRDNRAMIDECINNVIGGKKPAHYLAYGDTRRPTY